MPYCPRCGTVLVEYARFCGNCGYVRSNETTAHGMGNSKHFHPVGMEPLDDSPATLKLPILTLTHTPVDELPTGRLGAAPVDELPTNKVTVAPRTPSRLNRVLDKLPAPVRHAISTLITRAGDPEPEAPPKYMPMMSPRPKTWGWLSVLMLTSAGGVLSIAYGYTALRFGEASMEIFFWLGILLIFVPTAVRLILPALSRFERITLVCVVGISLYLVFVIYTPISFSPHDAFLHWRTADDIASSQHLFMENTLLPASPFYPGLEIVTNALSTLSGLSIFQSGLIVIGVARLVMVLSLFLLFEHTTRSARIAGIATLLYMVNPHFIFFDSDFSYESLALPIATFMLFALARRETLSNHRRVMLLAAWIALSALVVTHHVTDYFFDGFLILWTVICLFQRPAPGYRFGLVAITVFAICVSLAWIALRGNPVVDYLSSYFGRALDEMGQILTGASKARQLFADYSGAEPTPLWERLMTIVSALLVMSCLPLGLLCIWQRYRRNAFACMLAATSLLYPLVQVFRFTNFGSEITDRAAAFLYIPLACLLAIFIVQFWPTRRLNRKRVALISCAMTILFLGGVISPPWQLLPGPYLVSADPRSLEPEGIDAALWARSNLGPNNHVATDRINGILMDTYGDQRVQSSIAGDIDVTPVFISSRLDASEVALLKQSGVRYLVVDLRLSTALPTIGFYFETGEPGSFVRTTPLSLEDLTKFNAIPQINRIFDSGDIIIYDVGGLTNAPQTP